MTRQWLVATVALAAACSPMTTTPDGGAGGGSAGGATAGGSAGGSTAGGSAAGGSAGGATAGGSAAGGSAGGTTAGGSAAGGSAGGSTAGGSAGGATAGGSAAGGSAGGSTAGGSAGGASAGGSTGGGAAGGSTAGGAAGGSTGGGAAGGSTAGGAAGGSTAGGSAGGSGGSLCLPGAYDAGIPGGALFADGGFTGTGALLTDDAGVIATATSTYAGFPASSVLDFNVNTSWYVDSTCTATSGNYCCDADWLELTLPSASTVTAIVLRGNAGSYPDGYDFLTARLELLSANGGVLATRDVVFNRPRGDWAVSFSPAISNVRGVRLRPGWAEDAASGLSEVQVYLQ